MGLVALDLHAPAAAIAALAASQVLVEVLLGEPKAGGHAVDDGGEGLAVGLAGREKAERHVRPRYFGAMGVLAMPAPPWPVTIDGVTKITSSRPVSLFSFCLKSQPRMGMSPKSGTLRTVVLDDALGHAADDEPVALLDQDLGLGLAPVDDGHATRRPRG